MKLIYANKMKGERSKVKEVIKSIVIMDTVRRETSDVRKNALQILRFAQDDNLKF